MVNCGLRFPESPSTESQLACRNQQDRVLLTNNTVISRDRVSGYLDILLSVHDVEAFS